MARYRIAERGDAVGNCRLAFMAGQGGFPAGGKAFQALLEMRFAANLFPDVATHFVWWTDRRHTGPRLVDRQSVNHTHTNDIYEAGERFLNSGHLSGDRASGTGKNDKPPSCLDGFRLFLGRSRTECPHHSRWSCSWQHLWVGLQRLCISSNVACMLMPFRRACACRKVPLA